MKKIFLLILFAYATSMISCSDTTNDPLPPMNGRVSLKCRGGATGAIDVTFLTDPKYTIQNQIQILGCTAGYGGVKWDFPFIAQYENAQVPYLLQTSTMGSVANGILLFPYQINTHWVYFFNVDLGNIPFFDVTF